MPVTQHQFCKLSLSNIKLAIKIKELRSRKHLTQKQLADSAGISEAAIRNYETGANAPRASRLEALANALGVRPEALRSYDFGDGGSVTFNALFQLADGYGLMPFASDNETGFTAKNDFMWSFLYEWSGRYAELRNGTITLEVYKKWRDRYAESFVPSDFPERYELVDGVYKLIEPYQGTRFSQTLKALRKESHITQSELAISIGGGSCLGAVRSYEQATRLPKQEHISKFAEVFSVTEGALVFFDYGSPIQAAHALFQLADEYGLYPRYREHDYHLVSGLETPRFLSTFIKQWSEAYVRWVGNDERAYKSWQRHYKLPQAQAPINRKAFDEQGPYRPRDAESLLAENIKLRQANEELTKRNLELEKMRDRLLAILSGTA